LLRFARNDALLAFISPRDIGRFFGILFPSQPPRRGLREEVRPMTQGVRAKIANPVI
jgi:hypothetical protein